MFNISFFLGESGTAKTDAALLEAAGRASSSGKVLYICRGSFSKALVNDQLFAWASEKELKVANWTTHTIWDLAKFLGVLPPFKHGKPTDVDALFKATDAKRRLSTFVKQYHVVIFDQADDYNFLFQEGLSIASKFPKIHLAFVLSQGVDSDIARDLASTFPSENLKLMDTPNPSFISQDNIEFSGDLARMQFIVEECLDCIDTDEDTPPGMVAGLIDINGISDRSLAEVADFGYKLWRSRGHSLPTLGANDLDPERRILIAPQIRTKGVKALRRFKIDGPGRFYKIVGDSSQATAAETRVPFLTLLNGPAERIGSLKNTKLFFKGERVYFRDANLNGDESNWWIEISFGAAFMRIHPSELEVAIEHPPNS